VRRIVHTDKAPPAVGPYSQAVVARADRLVFTAGQIGMRPETGTLADGVEAQAEQVLKNLSAVLEAAGSGLDRVVKMSVFLRDMTDFQKVNAVYSRFVSGAPPARAAFQVAALPLGALVEMEAVAVVDGE
jgi:2-iminobutanoate/2-iminopropanoate deaminase